MKTEEASDGPLCWVCAEGSSRTRSRKLVRGCACRGTDAGFAHLSCLVQAARHDEDRWQVCPTCQQDFTGHVRLGLARARWKLYRTLSNQDWQRLNAADSLASALHSTGDHAGALPLFQEVLAVSRRIDGNDDINTLVSMNNLASLHQNMGNHGLARPLFEEALWAQRRTLGNEAPDTLRTINNLAVLHLRIGNFTLSLPLAEEALAARQRTLGKEHVDTLISLDSLGLLRWHMAHEQYVSFADAETHVGPCAFGQLELALKFMGEASQGRCRVLGKSHPLTKESVRALGYMERRLVELRSSSTNTCDEDIAS